MPVLEEVLLFSSQICRLSPSPATGLVGMQENVFLSDYFGCVGFLPLTSQSDIRETLVKMFAGSIPVQHSDSAGYSTTERHFNAIMPADSQLPVDPRTCVFWSAVALGSLVKGRPIESVEKYSCLARDALANVVGPPNADVARAWAILAYMSDFCGDHDNFHVFLQRANDILCDVQEEGSETLPLGLSDVVKHGETIKLFIGDVDREEVESFCSQERVIPQQHQVVLHLWAHSISPTLLGTNIRPIVSARSVLSMNEAATEGEICQFVMQSFRSLEQDLYENVCDYVPTTHALGGDGEPSTKVAWGNFVGAELLRGSSPHFIASFMQKPGARSCSSRIVDMMAMMLRMHTGRLERLEHAADRPKIRGGIGGLIINGTLVFEKVVRKDMPGALEKLEKCSEVLQRYPGLCRFTMGSHITHMLLANLAVIDDSRARGIYDKLRAACNSALRPGTRAIPRFEEWQGVSSCCDNYYCRLMELMVMTKHNSGSFSPPPQDRVAEMHEMRSNHARVDDQQQRRAAPPTSSRDGAKGNSVFVLRPRHEAIDVSGSTREPERVSFAESVGWMENISSKGCQAALSQAPETTLSISRFGKGALGPVVDFDICRTVVEQSELCTELGAQAAEALLPLEFSMGRTVIKDETDDESIDVEDWLDVTHAMLDTAGSELDLEFGRQLASR